MQYNIISSEFNFEDHTTTAAVNFDVDIQIDTHKDKVNIMYAHRAYIQARDRGRQGARHGSYSHHHFCNSILFIAKISIT